MREYFYKNARVQVVEEYTNTQSLVSCDGTRMFVVFNDHLEQPCDEAFKIGDEVESLVGSEHNPFTGIVTGYEYDMNRVICVSTKLERYANDRIRYSYAVHELKPIDLAYITFEPGRYYRINESFSVLAVADGPHIKLFHSDINSDKPFAIVNIREFKPRLALNHKIYSIQKEPDVNERSKGRQHRKSYASHKRERN